MSRISSAKPPYNTGAWAIVPEEGAIVPSAANRTIAPPVAARRAPLVEDGEQYHRQAVLLSFCDPLPPQCSVLWSLSRRDWHRLLRWLDLSGLALYFLHRTFELQLSGSLPDSVRTRLEENLEDNTERTRSMIAESVAIQRDLQRARVTYALLKGLSLWPSSAPAPELRLQFDLDFLVAEKSAAHAREILEQRGYRLYHASRRSLEFKRNEKPGISLQDLYKAQPSHAVELHIEPDQSEHSSPLDRLEWRDLHGCSMPVLSAADLLLGQGLHAYKHVCGEFSRVSHLLEFRHHVLARREDTDFWREFRAIGEENPRAPLGLGLVTLLITEVMGEFAPEALTEWTVRSLPEAACLWVRMYGCRSVFRNFPGSKLYLLLQKELEAAGVPAQRSPRRILLPYRLPSPIIRALPGETLPICLARHRMQIMYILLRLRFHLVEGLRYAWESYRWRGHKRRCLS